MFPVWVVDALAPQVVEVRNQSCARLSRLDHVVEIAPFRRGVGVGEGVAVLLDEVLALVLDSDRDVTDITEVGLFNGAGTEVLTYRGEPRGSSEKRVFYRVSRSDGWDDERPIAGGERPGLTFWQATYAPGSDGFLSVFMGRNFSEDQNNDLFAVRHAYNPDLSVNASARTNGSQLSPGDQFDVDYTVTNAGDLPVSDSFDVRLYAASDLVAERSVTGLDVGENATGTFTATAGSPSYTVRVVPTSGLTELTRANNNRTIRPFEPDLRVASVATNRTGDQIRYNLTVENAGGVAVETVEYAVKNGATTLHTGTISSLAGSATTRVSGTIPVQQVDQQVASRLVLDPADDVGEANEHNNNASITLLAPDLSVSSAGITYYQIGSDLVASVTVANRGPGATTGELVISHDGTEAGTQTFSIEGASESNITVFETVNVTLSGVTQDDVVTAVVEGEIPDSTTLDNAATGRITDIQEGETPDSVVDQYDSNGDGAIDIVELGAAATDFAANDLSITELSEVATAFASS